MNVIKTPGPVSHGFAGSYARGLRHVANRWWVPAGLIVLNLIPVIGGAFRLTELTGGADITGMKGFSTPRRPF